MADPFDFTSLVPPAPNQDPDEPSQFRSLVPPADPAPEIRSVSNRLIDSIIEVESGGNVNAVSRVGAIGPAQIMPNTARDPGFGVDPVDDPRDMVQSRRFVAQYMGAMIDRYGNLDDALMAYNWGPGSVDNWIAEGRTGPVPQETLDYVERNRSILGSEFSASVDDLRMLETPATQARQDEATSLQLGVPPEVVAGDRDTFRRRQQAEDIGRQIREAGPATQEFVTANPSTTNDDIAALNNVEHTWVGDVVRQTGARAVRLGGGLSRFVQTIDNAMGPVGDVLSGDFLNLTGPLFGQSIIRSREDIARMDEIRRGRIDVMEGMDFGGQVRTSWDDVKEAPLRSFLPFAIEQGLVSTPDMIAAITMLPAYVAARVGEMGQNRSVNDHRQDATVGDLIAVLPAGVASALLERFGARGILGIDDAMVEVGTTAVAKAVAKAGAKEAGTEFFQESLESTAETLGTMEGFDLMDTLERGVAGAVGGLGFGATTRSITATVESGVKSRQAQRNVNRRLQTAQAVQQTKIAQERPDLSIQHTADVMGEEGAVSIAPEAVTPELAESLGISPNDYAVAQGIGSDIELTSEQHAAIMLMPEYEALNMHIRTTPDDMTGAEAEVFNSEEQELQLQAAVEAQLEQEIVADLPQPIDVAGLPDGVQIIPEIINAGQAPTSFDVIVRRQDGIPQLLSSHGTLEGAVQAAGGDVAKLELQLSPAQSNVVNESVDVAADMIGMNGLFATAQEAGMTESTFQSYLTALDGARQAAIKRQARKMLRQQERETGDTLKGHRARIEIEQRESLRALPVYSALDAIGRDRLNRAALIEILPNGADQLPDLPVQSKGRRIFTNADESGGIHPEALAQRFGFPGADVMLFAMMDAAPFEAAVDSRVNQVMKERFGDMMRSQDAVNEALKSLHNDNSAEIIATEINQLTEARSAKKVRARHVRQAARQMLGKTRIGEIKVNKFMNAERRWSSEAGRLLRKSNRAGAADAKFKQLANHQMALEATRARDRIAKHRRFISKFQNRKQNFPGIDAAHVDLIHAILEHTNFRPKRPEAQLRDLQKKAEEVRSRTGAIIDIPPSIEAGTTLDWRDMTLDQFETIFETVAAIEAQGRKAKKIKTADGEREFDEVRNELLSKTADLKEIKRAKRQRNQQNPGRWDRGISRIAGFKADLKKVEFMLEDLDRSQTGPWHRAIFQPIADAQNRQHDMIRDVMKPIITNLKKLPASRRRVFVPSMDRYMTRNDLLALALNAGNESNLEKVILGSENDNRSKPWTRDGIEAALQLLTEKEADWVQTVWDALENMRPEVERIFREEHGRRPERIVPTQFKVGGKTLKGGYFPMMYDRKRAHSKFPGQNQGDALDMMRARENQSSVFSGMTKERTGFAAPVMLDLEAMPQAFHKTIHFVTHYEAVRDTQRVLHDPQLRTEIRTKLSPEYYEEMDGWLSAVATNGNTEVDQTTFGPLLEWMRGNITAAVMGLSYTTGISQTFGLSSSVAVLGTKENGKFSNKEGMRWLGTGLAMYGKNPRAATRQAMERSSEMRNRITSFDREVSQTLKRMAGKSGPVTAWRRHTLQIIGGIQFYSVDVPTWIGAYNQGLNRGMNDVDASRHADAVLRKSQASGSLKDLSRIQRKRGAWQLLTMFSTYTMTLFNMMTQTGKGRIQGIPSVSRLAWLLAFPALLEMYMRQNQPDEDDDEETFLGNWALQTMGFALSTVPIAGQVFESGIHGFDYDMSPSALWGERIVAGLNELPELFEEGDEFTRRDFRNVLNGVTFGLGVGGASQLDRVLRTIEAEDEAELYDFLIGYRQN